MSQPLISVILPVYNAQDFLKESIQSILKQTYKHLELIIINDGSTDNSKKIIQAFKDERIHLFDLPKNGGLIKALNYGLQQAKGKYVARMDADDISFVDRLAVQLYYLKKTGADIIGSYIIQKGGTDKTVKYPVKNENIKAYMLFGNPMVHPAIFFKREMIEKKVFHYSAEWKHVEDYELWIRLMKDHKFANVPKPLLYYRISENSICFQQHDKQFKKNAELHQIILKQLIPDYHFSETELNWIENPALKIKKDDLIHISHFIETLSAANHKKELFNEKAFSKRMMLQFYRTCVSNKKENIITLFKKTAKKLNNSEHALVIKLMGHTIRKKP